MSGGNISWPGTASNGLWMCNMGMLQQRPTNKATQTVKLYAISILAITLEVISIDIRIRYLSTVTSFTT